MSKDISRRDFIKLLGGSAAASVVLTGCGPASRYVTRETYPGMPEYTYNGKSTFYATTCFECDAGCGLIVRTMQGRAIKVEGNQNNPVNVGKTCARGQTTLQGLYNPDRVKTAVKQNRKSQLGGQTLNWDDSIQLVADVLGDSDPNQLGFLLGSKPDHLFDLVSEICITIGAPPPIRYSALAMYESRATLQEAASFVFKEKGIPSFDLGNSDIVFSFGSNFLETWLSPVANTQAYSKFRKGFNRRRGYLVQFEPRMSQTAAVADEWIPIKPGTEGFAALGLGRMVAEVRGTLPRLYKDVDIKEVSRITGVSTDEYLRLARIFAIGERPLAIPGGAALGQTNGLETAKLVLALNGLAGNFGKPGGVNLLSNSSDESGDSLASLTEMNDFIARMASGEIKVLLVHGVNPVFEIPRELGFEEALGNVPLVISFSSFPDETALQSDYILPDHSGLESWGYQRVKTGINRNVISGAQPVVSPYYDTRSTVDVLLAGISQVGGGLASAVPFDDEVAYLKNKIIPLIGTEKGIYDAPEINTFFTRFQQYGGWWKTEENQVTIPVNNILDRPFSQTEPTFSGDGDFYLLPFVSPVLGEAGANKPSLQEIPDPITTVMWNTWVEINNQTAKELDIHDNDVIRIVSVAGSIEVPVYISPGIRPDAIAIPFGQGHTAYGRYAKDRGANPNDLLALKFNESGDLAFASNLVKIEKTGQKQHLSRLGSPLTDTGLESH